MITLEDKALTFTFPKTTERLRKQANEYCDYLSRRFISEISEIGDSCWLARQIVMDSPYSEKDALGVISKMTMETMREAIKQYVENRKNSWYSSMPSIFDNSSELCTGEVSFQRTLRIPDDGKSYPLPPGLGSFPVEQVDGFSATLPEGWAKRGGVMIPMHQCEAIWLKFKTRYPCALKVATGKIDAVSGKPWTSELLQNPQNYLVLPDQPWLDGYSVAKGMVRQFVAIPLSHGYTAEEQLTGAADFGGIQLQISPLHSEIYFESTVKSKFPGSLESVLHYMIDQQARSQSLNAGEKEEAATDYRSWSMGLAPGGRIRQQVFKDKRPLSDWDQTARLRCFVHLCNSISWKKITGKQPPHPPLTPQDYNLNGLPWFDYYQEDIPSVPGSRILGTVKSVSAFSKQEGDDFLLHNESFVPKTIITLPNQVQEWDDKMPERKKGIPEDIPPGDVKLKLQRAKFVQDAIGTFGTVGDRKAARLILHGYSDKEILNETGVCFNETKAIRAKLDQALWAKIEKFVARGLTLKDLLAMTKEELDKLDTGQ